MKRRVRRPGSYLLLLLLMLWISGCDATGGQMETGLRPAPTAASVLLGPQPCPAPVQASSFWARFVHPTGVQKVEGVACGYLMGQPVLQAVVMVRSSGPDRLLDLHVFTNLAGSAPAEIFKLIGLQGGAAKISNYNTLLTDQDGWQPFQNTQIRHTLAREFKWSDSAHTLVQVGFVGLYPDITRYQAEDAQQEVNASQGGRGWQLDAVSTAQSFAEFVLQWPEDAPATIVSGGGAHDAQAVVLVSHPALDQATIQVSLSRLELNTNGGIWEVTDVATKGMTLTAPHSLQQLASPVQVTGSASLRTGEHIVLAVLNDERTVIGQTVPRLNSAGEKVTFKSSMSYASPLFRGDIQEGMLALYTLTANQQIVGCVMEKVLLQD